MAKNYIMDYINTKTGQIAKKQGFGFHIDFGEGHGMLMPGQYIRGNPDWKPIPEIPEEIKNIISPKS